MRNATIILSLALATASVHAQVCAFNGTSDPVPSAPLDGADIALFCLRDGPPGQGVRTQVLVHRHSFQNVPVLISDIACSVDMTGQTRFGSLRVDIGYFAGESLDSIFANNVATGVTTVLDARDHVWPHRRYEWNDIGLQQPFWYVPAAGNLLIDVTAIRGDAGPVGPHNVYAYSAPTTWRVVADRWIGTPPTSGSADSRFPKLRLCVDRASLLYFGEGCAGSGGTRPALGFTGSAALNSFTTWWLSNARASSTAVLQLGADSRAPYPLPLDAAGMPGCRLYFGPLVAFVLATDGLGVGKLTTLIPPQVSLVGSSFYGQFFVVDPTANTAGLAASNYGRVLVGR